MNFTREALFKYNARTHSTFNHPASKTPICVVFDEYWGTQLAIQLDDEQDAYPSYDPFSPMARTTNLPTFQSPKWRGGCETIFFNSHKHTDDNLVHVILTSPQKENIPGEVIYTWKFNPMSPLGLIYEEICVKLRDSL